MRRTCLVLALALVAACQDDPDHTVANCQLYQDTYCSKQADCGVELRDIKKSEQAANEQACHERFASQGLGCGDLSRVSDTYDQCIQDLDKWSCVQFYNLSSDRHYVPLSCVNVLVP